MNGRALRIGIDAHILGKNKGGVETVVRNLIYGLAEIDSANQYFIYVGKHHGLQRSRLPASFHISPLVLSNPWIERLMVLPYLYRRDRLDVLHVQRAVPLWGCPRTVVHVHDVEHKSHPELFRGPAFRIKSFLFEWSARHCTRVVTVSQASLRDIERYYSVPPGKIDVVPNGVDTGTFFSEPGISRKPPFLLFVGALERNKNVDGLLRAFAAVRRRVPGLQLVIVGAARDETRGGYVHELHGLCDGLGVRKDVTFAGYVPVARLRQLMSAAAAVVFPSWAEGFGLPPLEAMACGAPVVASRIPAISEVCGDAAVLAAPGDDDALSSGISRILLDEEFRAAAVTKGLRRANEYKWRHCAAGMLESYYRAVNGQ